MGFDLSRITHESLADAEGPFVSTGEAAQLLGLESRESIRRLVGLGKLPARRAHDGYNGPLEIPLRAVKTLSQRRGGMRSHHGAPDVAFPESSEGGSYEPDRRDDTPNHERELGDALFAIRASNEHRRRAFLLQSQAFSELMTALDILEDAVASVAVPRSPGSL